MSRLIGVYGQYIDPDGVACVKVHYTTEDLPSHRQSKDEPVKVEPQWFVLVQGDSFCRSSVFHSESDAYVEMERLVKRINEHRSGVVVGQK